MQKIIFTIGLAALVAACDTPGQTALLGAATGAAIGAQTAGRDETKGALLGAAVGLAAGAVAAGAQGPAQCRFVYPDGSEYVADCPR